MTEIPLNFTLKTSCENSNIKISIEDIVGSFACFVKIHLYICKDSIVKSIETANYFKNKQILLPKMKVLFNIENILLKDIDKLIIVLEIEGKNIAYSFDYDKNKKDFKNQKELKFLSKTGEIFKKMSEENKARKEMDFNLNNNKIFH